MNNKVKGNIKAKKLPANTAVASSEWIPPVLFGEQIEASTYRRGTTGAPAINPYPNISNAPTPFSQTGMDFDAREAVSLCVKAYWNFSLLRNVVEVMGELANSGLIFKGGNKKTRDFIKKWWERVNGSNLTEQCFREWFRSGNGFIYASEGAFSSADIEKMTQTYGSEFAEASLTKKKIPIRYTVLNPETVTASGSISFQNAVYYKLLTQYELQRLKNPQTEDDKLFFNSLDAETRKSISQGTSAKIKLKPENLSVLLYKTQDYEPMGIPMAYGVLKDIEAKMELKRIDLSIARTTDRALLLITVGEPINAENKGFNVNYTTLKAIQTAFATESIGRTLVTDYSVKGDWLIPDVEKILGADKYIQLDKDINVGLNAVLFNEGEKFANTSIKVQIFIERLKEARNAFINKFLQKEIIKVCQAIGAKSYPQVSFQDLSLKDEISFLKIVTQLAQLGFLTPDEMFEAMDNGKLPLPEESIQSQRTFKELRDEGLYMPIIGSSTALQEKQVGIQKEQLNVQKDQNAKNHEIAKQQVEVSKVKAMTPAAKPPGQKGRPQGSTGPKAPAKPSPMGSKASGRALTGYSLSQLQSLVPVIGALHNDVEKQLSQKFNIKSLDEAQAKVGSMIVESIITNEEKSEWHNKIGEYLKTPKEISAAAANEITEIQLKHNVDSYLASMLRLVECPAPQGDASDE